MNDIKVIKIQKKGFENISKPLTVFLRSFGYTRFSLILAALPVLPLR